MTMSAKKLLTILLTIAICRAEAGSIRVSAEGGLRSIRMAIRMAAPGDTIFVGRGIYRTGNLVIDKPLHLIGEGNPVLDGGYFDNILSSDHIMQNTADGTNKYGVNKYGKLFLDGWRRGVRDFWNEIKEII